MTLVCLFVEPPFCLTEVQQYFSSENLFTSFSVCRNVTADNLNPPIAFDFEGIFYFGVTDSHFSAALITFDRGCLNH